DESGQWKDGETSFFRISCWRQLAENVAESLTRGSRTMVAGRLRMRQWETQEGEKRSVVEIEADEVGPSLKWATAKVERTSRGGGSGGGGAGRDGGGSDEWGTDTPAVPAEEEVPF